MTTDTKAMPCPFCGGEPWCRLAAYSKDGTPRWAVGCNACGAMTGPKLQATEAAAIEQWNRRASPSTDQTTEDVMQALADQAQELKMGYETAAESWPDEAAIERVSRALDPPSQYPGESFWDWWDHRADTINPDNRARRQVHLDKARAAFLAAAVPSPSKPEKDQDAN
jgi:Lar family restriction alleviation protein